MEQEQAIVDIYITNGGACLAICRHIWQFIVLAEGLSGGCRTNTSSDVHLLAHNVFPYTVDGLDVRLVASKGSHISHTGIHICGTHGVSHSLILLKHWQVTLTVLALKLRLSAIVEQELCFIKVFLLASQHI